VGGAPIRRCSYYGLALTWFPSAERGIGSGIDFTHYKMYAETAEPVRVEGVWDGIPIAKTDPFSSRAQNLEISHGVNLVALNLGYRWSPARFSNRLQPEAGVGVGGFLPHAEGSINGVSSGGNYQWAGAGYQVFAGAEYRFTRRMGLLLRAKFDVGDLDIDLQPHARLQTKSRTRHAIAGVSIHF